MQRKIAFSHVVLPSGEMLRREVVVFNSKGFPIEHFPLTEELPFVEWSDTTYYYGDSISD